MKRRKTDKAGWYERITVPVDERPTCSQCGVRTYIIDREHGECLRCLLMNRKEK
jgi:transposase